MSKEIKIKKNVKDQFCCPNCGAKIKVETDRAKAKKSGGVNR